MPEAGGHNIEIAHHLTEPEMAQVSGHTHRAVEWIEAVILALVAITSAWSGVRGGALVGDSICSVRAVNAASAVEGADAGG